MKDESIVKFCPECQSRLKAVTETNNDNKQLVFICYKCQYRSKGEQYTFISITKKYSNSERNTLLNLRSPAFPYDPTVSRYRNIPCPNTECPTRDEGENSPMSEVIAFSYFNQDMSFTYMCGHCKHMWS